MKLKLTNALVIIIFIFCQDLRRQGAAIKSNICINQWYASFQIPLVRHIGTFTDWLKFVASVAYHF